ncbi:YceI family protein [Actinacidiphila paucisporea]|uniref:Polyisoprenoid-binding protein YceI n=1 Tax=Actinacidiphila paucisporea TaxID=310782 RepID=A0A1M7I693_9ACTN|nr:YceI family protein [Actinacidiphila paucisporea]SHM36149.1 Polyisoprenoid-binding protein YceI [Actinacidiphila paucisporea]
MSTQVSIPGYQAGTWVIDAARSEIAFLARALGFWKTRGTFADVEGTVVLKEDPLDSSVSAVIQSASLNTGMPNRDRDLKRAGYLDAERYPTITFTSTGVRADGDGFLVDGDLTVLAATEKVTLALSPKGFETGADGTSVATFSASTQISNKALGVTKGSAFINDTTAISLEIVAVRKG